MMFTGDLKGDVAPFICEVKIRVAKQLFMENFANNITIDKL